ncbi:hypothetical protein pb186bvf_016997 [Paramecium bursaria]
MMFQEQDSLNISQSDVNYPGVYALENRMPQKLVSDNDLDKSSISSDPHLSRLNKRKDRKGNWNTRARKSYLPTPGKKYSQLFHIANKIKYFFIKIKQNAYIYPRDLKIQQYLKEQYLSITSTRLKYQETQGNSLTTIPLIKPSGLFYVIWQVITLLSTLYTMWWIPFINGFNYDDNQQQFELFVFILAICDILLKFNREIIDKGEVINQRYKIIQKYMKTELCFDIIYIISFAYMIFLRINGNFFLVNIFDISLFIMNIIKFRHIVKSFQEALNNNIYLTELINLLELLVLVYYVAHYMACIWYHVGSISIDEYNISWITQYNIDKYSDFVRYAYSFYWATTTMVTVGYGDISAQNLYEVIACTILMFVSSATFGFAINSIGMILSNLENQSLKFKKNLQLINNFMIQNHVGLELQSKVRNYLKYIFERQINVDNIETQQVIDKLSINLKQELIYDVQRKIINQSHFITNNFSEKVQKDIAQELEPVSYAPNEVIYQQDRKDPCSLYILVKGEVHLIDHNSQKILKILSNQGTFGQYEMLQHVPRYCTAIANQYSQLYRIPRQKVLDIISNSQLDFEQFHNLKDSLSFKVNQKSVCYACGQNHIIWDCRYLFYKPNIEKIIKKELFHGKQEREYRSRHTKKYPTLLDIKMTQDAYNVFREHVLGIQMIQLLKTKTMFQTQQSPPESKYQSDNFTSYKNQKSAKPLNSNSREYQYISSHILQSDEDYKHSEYIKRRRNSQITEKLRSLSQQKFQPDTHREPTVQLSNQQVEPTQKILSLDDKEQFINLDFDKIHIFQKYQKHNNVDKVLELYTQYQREKKRRRGRGRQIKYSNYQFFKVTR